MLEEEASIHVSAEYLYKGTTVWLEQTIYLTEAAHEMVIDYDEDTAIDITFGNGLRALGAYGKEYSFATAYYENVMIGFATENITKVDFEAFIANTKYR